MSLHIRFAMLSYGYNRGTASQWAVFETSASDNQHSLNTPLMAHAGSEN